MNAGATYMRVLASLRLRLMLRQALRAAAFGVLAGSVFAALGVLFATVLPRALVGASADALAAALAAGVAGMATGVWLNMRGYRAPGALDCALVLEAADAQRGGALVTLVGIGAGNDFATALIAPANAELARTRALKLAPVLPLWLMLAAPLAALCAALLSAAAVSMPRVEMTGIIDEGRSPRPGAVDIASARSEADAAAFAAAAKMTRAAASLKIAANTIKNPSASTEAKENALADAARAMAGVSALAGGSDAAPRELPAGEADLLALAAKLEAAAGRYGEIAGEFKEGKRAPSGVSDRATGGDAYARVMAPFPVFERRVGAAESDILASQPLARRQIAQRAVELAGK
ncbi:MAG: hypothetical protein IT462_16680 [Planctomycetes bacterium]|nr:hypothetical protein [Planctomycetota bacterium]